MSAATRHTVFHRARRKLWVPLRAALWRVTDRWPWCGPGPIGERLVLFAEEIHVPSVNPHDPNGYVARSAYGSGHTREGDLFRRKVGFAVGRMCARLRDYWIHPVEGVFEIPAAYSLVPSERGGFVAYVLWISRRV